MTHAELDERRAAVLRAIVEEYVSTAQPVGSATVLRRRRLKVSPATVRNDMAMLEAHGFITQPHTSAGRVPSDLGYRYFVDHYARADRLTAPERETLGHLFDSARRELEDVLGTTSRILGAFTSAAAVVTAPQVGQSLLVSVHLTLVQPHLLVAVLVTEQGRVIKVVAESADDFPSDRVGAANEALSRLLVDTPAWRCGGAREPCPDPGVEGIVAAVLAAVEGLEEPADGLFLGGAATVAERFTELEVVHDILATLEKQAMVVDLLQGLLADESDVVVRIGSEMTQDEFRRTSVVVTTYQAGNAAGAVGIVGPTRMDYSKVMSAVNYVAERLQSTLHAQD